MIGSAEIRRIGVAAAALLVLLLAGAGSHAQSASAPPAAEVSKLRILFVGHPGSEREKDFVQFLGQHFEIVKTADLNAFAQAGFKDQDAEGFDVTILDYDGDGFKAPRPRIVPRFLDFDVRSSPSLAGRWFSRPLITVGVAGGLMCSQWGLKTGYL
jgi:hypothetical protein